MGDCLIKLDIDLALIFLFFVKKTYKSCTTLVKDYILLPFIILALKSDPKLPLASPLCHTIMAGLSEVEILCPYSNSRAPGACVAYDIEPGHGFLAQRLNGRV